MFSSCVAFLSALNSSTNLSKFGVFSSSIIIFALFAKLPVTLDFTSTSLHSIFLIVTYPFLKHKSLKNELRFNLVN